MSVKICDISQILKYL